MRRFANRTIKHRKDRTVPKAIAAGRVGSSSDDDTGGDDDVTSRKGEVAEEFGDELVVVEAEDEEGEEGLEGEGDVVGGVLVRIDVEDAEVGTPVSLLAFDDCVLLSLTSATGERGRKSSSVRLELRVLTKD